MPLEDPRPNYFALSPTRRKRAWQLIKHFARLQYGFPPNKFNGEALLFASDDNNYSMWQRWQQYISETSPCIESNVNTAIWWAPRISARSGNNSNSTCRITAEYLQKTKAIRYPDQIRTESLHAI